MNEAKSWLFQSNPALYDIERSVSEKREMTWVVNQSKREIKKGHRVYIWVSGRPGGIIASGAILSDPRPMPEDEGMTQYMKPGYQFKGESLRVRLQLDRVLLPSRIGRSQIQADPILKNLTILKFANATNYALSDEQVQAIEGILSDGSECIENLGADSELPKDEQPTKLELDEIRTKSEGLRTPAEADALLKILQVQLQNQDPKRKKRIANAIVRTPKIAKLVKEREYYRCQMCGEDGFEKRKGGKYAEVHHVEELGSGGKDLPDNMICVCASCHRRIHYAKEIPKRR